MPNDAHNLHFVSFAPVGAIICALADVVYDHPARDPYPYEQDHRPGDWDLGGNDVHLRTEGPGRYRVHQRYDVPGRMERLRVVAAGLGVVA